MLLSEVSCWFIGLSPDILILDDPTSSLDTKVTDQIFTQITQNEPWKSKTFVISSNNIKTFDYVDKIIVVKKGRVIFFGTQEEMMRDRGIAEMIEELQKAKEANLDQSKKQEEEDKEKSPVSKNP